MKEQNNILDVDVEMKMVIEEGKEIERYKNKAKGKLIIRNSRYILQFETNEFNRPTNNLYTIQHDEVSLKRSGAVEMFQKFIKNKITENVYRHPYGFIRMETKTKDICFTTSNQMNHLQLKYEVTLNDEQKRSHSLQLLFQKEDF